MPTVSVEGQAAMGLGSQPPPMAHGLAAVAGVGMTTNTCPLGPLLEPWPLRM